MTCQRWDLFCRIIDNYGDLGFTWRLAKQLAQLGKSVRLWVDQPKLLEWMADPGDLASVHGSGISVYPLGDFCTQNPGEVIITTFGCELPDWCVQSWLSQAVYIHIEYFSVEDYVPRLHGLPSPIQTGPAQGKIRWHYYPGLARGSGGILRPYGWQAKDQPTQSWDKLFLMCYHCYALPVFLSGIDLAQSPSWSRQGAHGFKTFITRQLHISPAIPSEHLRYLVRLELPSYEKRFLDWCTQSAFDAHLRQSDINLIRGEDSLVQALWMGSPFVWQIYAQDDGAHWDKLLAFLQFTRASEFVYQLFVAWNLPKPRAHLSPEFLDVPAWVQAVVAKPIAWTLQNLEEWSHWSWHLATQLGPQLDLVSKLILFAEEKHQYLRN
ncbi:MAG: elongation factor P maturation arginine rhamnosyltransferase EarP [Gammaproteobacteria bacterium]|nr:elongation factor P maturation arginine rhamnosyltransferase EarP [Gammaproteobacteria bacterium]